MDFLNSALLGGLAAISIPIIIHLLNRRRFKILHWAAMDFLLEAARMNRKRVQMEHLIVLLLRCLAIALVVLAVCRPVATRGALAKLPGARDQVERVVVVDDSASTGEKEGDKTAFDEEKRLVSELITDLSRERPGDLLTVIRGSRFRQPDLVRSEAKSGRTDDVARRVDSWQPSDRRFPLEECLRAALSSEHEGEKADKSALKRYVYFLTDFRKTDWQPESQQAIQNIHEEMKAAGNDTSFLIVDSGHDDPTNLGIVDLLPQEKIVTTGIGQKLIAKVKNYGRTAAHDVRLQLTVGGSSLPVTPVPEIKPGETKDVEISYTFADAGPFSVTVRLEGDRLPADDRRDVALEVVKAVRVLLVDGKPTDDAFESQTFFLERALTPPGDIKSGVEAVSIPAERLADEDLSNYHAVILCDLDRFPGQRLPALERYVREGGGLAFFLGEEVDATAYEKELWTAKERDKQGNSTGNSVGGLGILPCRLGELKPVFQTPAKLAAPGLDHPLLRIFAGDNNPFLSRVKSKRHFSLPIDGEKDRTTRVIARWEDFDKTPAIVEKPFGEGRVLIFNTSASRTWTDWPREASFPVTAQELVRYLAPASTKGHNLQVGEPILRDINPAAYESKAKLLVPGEKQPRELLASRRDQSEALWFSYPDTFTAGVYQLEIQPRASGSAPRLESYAVELDPREGELEKADKDGLVKQLEEGVKLKFFNANGTDRSSLLAMTEGERRELWRTCAFLLLAVLALEGILSFIAAHHGSSASLEEVEAARRGRPAQSREVPVSLPVAQEAHRPTSLPVADKS
jgi:hypothetical protein